MTSQQTPKHECSRWAREGVRPPRVGGSTAGPCRRFATAVRSSLRADHCPRLSTRSTAIANRRHGLSRCSTANSLSQRERVRERENGHLHPRASTRRCTFPGPEGQRNLAGGKAVGRRPRYASPIGIASRRDAGAALSSASGTPAGVRLTLRPVPGAVARLGSPCPRLSSPLPPGADLPHPRHA